MAILVGEAVRADACDWKAEKRGVGTKQITPILGVIYKK